MRAWILTGLALAVAGCGGLEKRALATDAKRPVDGAVALIEVPDMEIIVKSYEGSLEEAGERLAEMLEDLRTRGLEPSNYRGALVEGADEEEFDPEHARIVLFVGLPGRKSEARAPYETRRLPGGAAAVMTHVGPYDDIWDRRDLLLSWLRSKGYDVAGPLREIYLRGFGREEDRIVELQWPVRKR